MPEGATIARSAMQLLKAECFSCHNEKKKKGGLVLTSREALLKGSDAGPVAAPGERDTSLLAQVLLADADPHMPPERQLTEPQIGLIRAWIEAGLPWDEAALLEDDTRPVALAPLPPAYRPVLALALSADARRLAIGRAGVIAVHENAGEFPLLRQFDAHRDAVQALAWSPDGGRLASGAFRRVVLRGGAALDVEREWTDGLVGRITALEFSPDGASLAVADGATGRSGVVRLLDVADGRVRAAWPAHDDTIYGLDFSRDGTRLVTAGGDRLIKIWDVATHRELARLEGHGAQVLSVAFNADATEVASGGADRELHIWDVATREKVISLGTHTGAINAVNWPGDGKTVIAATSNGGVFAYTNLKRHAGTERSKGGDERKVAADAGALLCAVTSAAGDRIFAGGQDGVVDVWTHDGKSLAQLLPPPPAAAVVATTATAERPASFVLDVLPVLNRAGCSAGACHAKAEGQNGFKLSVFSYDPKGDYEAIVQAVRGRRVFPAAPEESLLVQKPTNTIDHEGGRRIEPESEFHTLLVRWLREGMAYRVPGEPELKRITVTPRERVYRPADEQALRVEAHYSDGSHRDVTHLAAYASNDPDVAAVTEQGVVKIGGSAGQGVVVARYMGFVADAQITIPAERLLRRPATPRCRATTSSTSTPTRTSSGWDCFRPGCAPTPSSCAGPSSTRSACCPRRRKSGPSSPIPRPTSAGTRSGASSRSRPTPITGRRSGPTWSAPIPTASASRACSRSTSGCGGASGATSRTTSSYARSCSPRAATTATAPR